LSCIFKYYYRIIAQVSLCEEASSLYGHCLHVINGKQVTGTKYSKILRDCFLKYIEMPIGVAAYRQIATAFMSQHLKRKGGLSAVCIQPI